MWRRATGKTSASFGTIFAASSTPSSAEVGEHGPQRDVEPAPDEEEGGQEGERDDAQPLLLRRCSAKWLLITSPRTKAGSTACPWTASASTMSTNRQTKTSLISGSITRSP